MHLDDFKITGVVVSFLVPSSCSVMSADAVLFLFYFFYLFIFLKTLSLLTSSKIFLNNLLKEQVY